MRSADMAKPAVYLDSSFIVRLAGPPENDPVKHQQFSRSREWWRTRRKYFLQASLFTLHECRDIADQRVIRPRQRYLRTAAVLRPARRELDQLAGALVYPFGPLPKSEMLDARHVATAADFRVRLSTRRRGEHGGDAEKTSFEFLRVYSALSASPR